MMPKAMIATVMLVRSLLPRTVRDASEYTSRNLIGLKLGQFGETS
jgi:hypothetical protein